MPACKTQKININRDYHGNFHIEDAVNPANLAFTLSERLRDKVYRVLSKSEKEDVIMMYGAEITLPKAKKLMELMDCF